MSLEKIAAGLRAWAVRAARGSSPRPFLQAAHRTVVQLEIGAASLWASRHRVPAVDPGNVTLVIKTFERPQTLRQMLRSTRRVFSGPIMVADDSQEPFTCADPRVRVLRLPFDSGVGAGRNALIDAVTTEYLWMADDDMILLPDFDLRRVLGYLSRNPEVDLCGGQVVNLPQLQTASYLNSDLFGYEGQPLRPLGTMIDGLPVAYKVPNWYVARTARLKEVRYDDRLKRVDHNDFFSSAYGRLLCVLDARMACLHAHSYFDPHYLSFRQDTAADLAYLGRKWQSGAGTMSRAEVHLDDEQCCALHHAALQVVARDLGVGIVHEGRPGDAVVSVLATAPGRERLVGGLLALGWQHAGSRLSHVLWGEAEVLAVTDFDQPRDAAVQVSFASVPGLAVQPHSWPPPLHSADPPDTRADWVRWSDKVGCVDAGDAVLAAALPIGPVYTLTPPGDLIWEAVGVDGAETATVIEDTVAGFDEVPDGADRQISDYLDVLVSRGLLERLQIRRAPTGPPAPGGHRR